MKRIVVNTLTVLLFGGAAVAAGVLMGEREEATMEFLYFGNLGATSVACPEEVIEWFAANAAFGVCGELRNDNLDWVEVDKRMIQSFVVAKEANDFIEFQDDTWSEDALLGFKRKLRFNLVDFTVGLNLESGVAVIARPELYWR